MLREAMRKQQQKITEHSPASCAPACAQSTTQRSQVNYCESHQHPNSAVSRAWRSTDFRNKLQACESPYRQAAEQSDNVEMCKTVVTKSRNLYILQELSNGCKGMLSLKTRSLLFCSVSERFSAFRRAGWWYNETFSLRHWNILVKHPQDSVTLKGELHVMETYIPQYMSGNHLGACKMSPVPTSPLEERPRCQVSLAMTNYTRQKCSHSIFQQVKWKLQLLILLSPRKQLHLMGVGLDTYCRDVESFENNMWNSPAYQSFYAWNLE